MAAQKVSVSTENNNPKNKTLKTLLTKIDGRGGDVLYYTDEPHAITIGELSLAMTEIWHAMHGSLLMLEALDEHILCSGTGDPFSYALMAKLSLKHAISISDDILIYSDRNGRDFIFCDGKFSYKSEATK